MGNIYKCYENIAAIEAVVNEVLQCVDKLCDEFDASIEKKIADYNKAKNSGAYSEKGLARFTDVKDITKATIDKRMKMGEEAKTKVAKLFDEAQILARLMLYGSGEINPNLKALVELMNAAGATFTKTEMELAREYATNYFEMRALKSVAERALNAENPNRIRIADDGIQLVNADRLMNAIGEYRAQNNMVLARYAKYNTYFDAVFNRHLMKTGFLSSSKKNPGERFEARYELESQFARAAETIPGQHSMTAEQKAALTKSLRLLKGDDLQARLQESPLVVSMMGITDEWQAMAAKERSKGISAETAKEVYISRLMKVEPARPGAIKSLPDALNFGVNENSKKDILDYYGKR